MTSKHAFANQVIRDLIETQAEFYLGWTLDTAGGEGLNSAPIVCSLAGWGFR